MKHSVFSTSMKVLIVTLILLAVCLPNDRSQYFMAGAAVITVVAFTSTGFGSGGKNALTALLLLISRLPFAPCAQIEALHSLVKLFPYHDTSGEALGVAMEDELSGALTLAFDLLEVSEDSLDATFDSRCPICANEENVLEPARRRLAEHGFTLTNETMTPPHYVDGNSDFVKTLLKAYERYTGRKGTCESMGGGTYVHSLKNGVAFGAAMPETDNRMHGADEFAVIDELLVSAKIFAQVITDLCR